MAKKLEIRVVQLEDGQKAIMDALTKMDGTLDGLDHVIRGNGSPGLVANQTAQEVRIKALEKARKSWRDLVILVTSGGVIALLTAAVQHFVR